MAHFTISEEAENALYTSDLALSMVESLAVHAGDEQMEITGAELAALLVLVRDAIRRARESAQ